MKRRTFWPVWPMAKASITSKPCAAGKTAAKSMSRSRSLRFGNHKVNDLLADGIGRAITEQAFSALVPTGDDALQILTDNRVIRRIHNGGEQKRRCGLPHALGNIERYSDEPIRSSTPGADEDAKLGEYSVFAGSGAYDAVFRGIAGPGRAGARSLRFDFG